tara:strand:- start:638 stop:859 length:222 start_codon:yes stop_codon:yes gene_type:complete
MNKIIILIGIALSGCLHDGPKSELYCDEVIIATSETGFAVHNSYYKYKIDGQTYRYAAVEGSTCKIIRVDNKG